MPKKEKRKNNKKEKKKIDLKKRKNSLYHNLYLSLLCASI